MGTLDHSRSPVLQSLGSRVSETRLRATTPLWRELHFLSFSSCSFLSFLHSLSHVSSTSMNLLSGLAVLELLSCSFSCQRCQSGKLRAPASVKTAFRSWNRQLNKVAAVTLQITDVSSHQRPDPGRWMGSLGKISRWSEVAGARLVQPSGFRSVGAALGWPEACAEGSFCISQETGSALRWVGNDPDASHWECSQGNQTQFVKKQLQIFCTQEPGPRTHKWALKLFRSPASEMRKREISGLQGHQRSVWI